MIDRARRSRPLLCKPALLLVIGLLLSGCGTLSRVSVDHTVSAVALDRPDSGDPPALPVAEPAVGDTTVSDAADLHEEDSLPVCSPAALETAATEAVPNASTSEEPPAAPAADDSVPPLAASEAEPEPLASVTEPAALALQRSPLDLEEEDVEPYDPWSPFNEAMFEFNRKVDRYVLKPVATAYDRVVPDRLQTMVANGFDNINSIPRMVNSLLQGKWNGAAREFGRFLINSTVGIGGLFDMAQQEWGIRRSQEDFGQTLGVWGAGPGPYLVLPFMEPMTVRDGIGRAVDGFLDPLNYVMPFLWERLAVRIGEAVNDRSLNLELFQGFEETVIDMYSAVRHVYLQRRERLIRE